MIALSERSQKGLLLPNSLKNKLYNQYVLSTMTSASKTWTLTRTLLWRLAAAQRNMQRTMIGVSYQDDLTNERVRSKAKARDIMHVVKARKWTWVIHEAHLQDHRWTLQVPDWRPMDGSRPRGRP